MSDFLERNVTNFFKNLDMKNKGYLSLKDFLGLAEHLADAEKTVGVGREQIIENFADLWRKYMKSAEGSDDEGLLTASILVASIRQQRHDPALKKSYLTACHNAFYGFDTNRDDFIQEAEFARAFAGMGFRDPGISRRIFEASDVNKDGKVSEKEFSRALYENIVSNDEKGRYALIWGPLE